MNEEGDECGFSFKSILIISLKGYFCHKKKKNLDLDGCIKIFLK